MRKTSLIIIAILALLTAKDALCDLRFQGNVALSERELLRAIDPGPEAGNISDQIINIYMDLGYFDAEVEREYRDQSQNRVFVINEGKQSKISAIDLEIEPDSLKLILNDLLDMYTGRAASQISLKGFADGCINSLTENGFPFARGEWTGFNLDENNNIIAAFKIIPGPSSIVSDIEFTGLKRTRPETLEKAGRINTGIPFSRREVLQSEKLIGKLPYVEVSSPYYLESSTNGDSCTVVYNIRELPSTRIEGFGGLINVAGKTDLIGRANIEFGDILGTGRMFSLFWNKKDTRSNELRIKYLEPFIFDSRIDLEIEAYQVDRDTLYITTGGESSFLHRFSIDLTGALYISVERTVPESGSNISRSIKRSAGARFKYDKSDFAPNPGSGYRFGTELEYRYRSNSFVTEGQNPPSNITSAGSDGAIYISPGGNFLAAALYKAWGIASANGIVPADEFRFIGGVRDLRGYTEQRFPAFRYLILTLEPRWRTGRYSRAYLYGDFGFIKGSQDREDEYRFKPGFGLGLVSRTGIGQVKVEIGWGDENFPDDAVFNFGIIGGF
ncbi:MAG: hypothetical protein JSW64_01930 [Candidatus Zixiibacteriota bacterium]|nr:MAG: hypothetical protein JSW64_01930 [candidate division Zixibacteria bacterium]